MHLEVDTVANRVTSYDGHLERTVLGTYPVDSTLAALVDAQEKEVSGQMDIVLATVKTDLTRGRGSENTMGDWITDAYRDLTGSNVACVNTGGIRKDMFAGPMTLRDVLEISPFGNELVTFTVSGATLKKIAEHQAMGGEHAKGLIFSGLTYKEKDGQLVRLRVDGKKVKAKKMYTFTASDFVVDHSMDYFGMPRDEIKAERTGYLDRDALVAYAKKYPEIEAETKARIVRE